MVTPITPIHIKMNLLLDSLDQGNVQVWIDDQHAKLEQVVLEHTKHTNEKGTRS